MSVNYVQHIAYVWCDRSILLRVATTQACPSASNQIVCVVCDCHSRLYVVSALLRANELSLAETGDDLLLFYTAIHICHSLSCMC